MCFLCFMCFLFFFFKLLSRPFSPCVFVMFLFFPIINFFFFFKSFIFVTPIRSKDVVQLMFNSIIMKIFVLEVDSHLVPFYCPFTILHQTNASVIVWKLQQCSVMSLEKKTHKTRKTHARHNICCMNSKKTHKTHKTHRSVIVWIRQHCSVMSLEKKHIKHVKHMHGIISDV